MRIEEHRPGFSRGSVAVQDFHFNSAGMLHGGVCFTLADTAMGAALLPALEPDQRCATIEIKINYFKPVTAGTIVCEATLVHRSRSVASLEADLFVGDARVARASGTFSIFTRRPNPKEPS